MSFISQHLNRRRIKTVDDSADVKQKKTSSFFSSSSSSGKVGQKTTEKGTYILKTKGLLTAKKYQTSFNLLNHKWSMSIDAYGTEGKQKDMQIYLWRGDTGADVFVPLFVDCNFILVHPQDSSKNICRKFRHRYENATTDWGFPAFIDLSELHSEFVVAKEIEMHIEIELFTFFESTNDSVSIPPSLVKNETVQTKEDKVAKKIAQNKGTYIHKTKGLLSKKDYAAYFDFLNHKWAINIYPHGTEKNKNNMQIYLYRADSGADVAPLFVDCNLILVHPQDSSKNIRHKFRHRYENAAMNLGFPAFTDLSKLHSEFIVAEEIEIHIEIELLSFFESTIPVKPKKITEELAKSIIANAKKTLIERQLLPCQHIIDLHCSYWFKRSPGATTAKLQKGSVMIDSMISALNSANSSSDIETLLTVVLSNKQWIKVSRCIYACKGASKEKIKPVYEHRCLLQNHLLSFSKSLVSYSEMLCLSSNQWTTLLQNKIQQIGAINPNEKIEGKEEEEKQKEEASIDNVVIDGI